MTFSSGKKSPPFAAFAPLKFFLAYLAFTLSLAIWGPVEYYMFPALKTGVFMLLVMISITCGYLYGVATDVSTTRKGKYGDDAFVHRLLDVSLVIALTAFAVSVISAVSSGQLNTDLSAIGETYAEGYEGYERNTGNYSLIFIVYSVSLPFNFIAIILGFYHFFSLDFRRKAMVLALAIGSLLFYVVGSGKQKQLGDIIIYLISVMSLKYAVRKKPIKIKWIVGGALFCAIALMAFAAVLGQRYSALGVDIDNVNRRVLDLIFVKKDHPLFSIFGTGYGLNIAIFSTYLSQGYYGLGLAMETKSHWTHFLGFSYSLSVIANRVFGLEWEWPNTLVHQVGLTTGWDETKWHTVFTHFATDFTFPGTIILFGFFAYIYARAWISAIRYENPFSILMFSLMTMGAFFMPANNQLFHSPGALFTLVVVSILYMSKGSQYNKPKALPGITGTRRVVPQRLL